MGKNFKEYQYINKIERVEPTKILIHRDTHSTQVDFKSPEECLKRFIELENELKEAWNFGRDN